MPLKPMTNWPHGDGEMCRQIRAHDWASTALGPIESWPPSFKVVVDLMLASGHAMQLAWGPERIMLYNDAYAPMLGARHPKALGIRFKDAWPDVWSDIAPMVARVFAGETLRYDDMPLVMNRSGYSENTWWNFSYSPVRDEAGNIAGLLNVTVDATSKHRAEQAERERDDATRLLEKNEERFRALVTAGANSIYQMSPDWRQMYQLDSETLAKTAAPIEDWVPKYIPDVDLDKVRLAIDKAIGSKSLFELEHRVLRPDGSIGWVNSRAVPLLDPAGEITEWFGAGTDVTARKLAEEKYTLERARAEAALRDADRNKDRFLAVLAHELRNGLAPLVYNAQIANLRLNDAAQVKELFSRSGRQLQHLVRLVDDLLDVARINTGKIELNVEQIRPREIVSLALEACRPESERKHHRLTVIDETDSGLVVQADRVRMTQVVSNLLSNAVKYMDAGGSITVRIARENGQALIEVSDTGIGIPPAALPHVFELFTQVRDQQAYSAGGLGIGLSLVKQLVELQGGTVDVVSEGSGQGSTFAVRLPATGGQNNATPAQAAGNAPGAAYGPLRVLVVDDMHDPADALVELLLLMGHEAEAAYGGEQALERVRQRRPDLVFLDLSMPGMDGFEMARRLRQDFAPTPPMHMVALTGRGREVDRQQTSAASFDNHLHKPILADELQSVLATARGLAAP